MNQKKTGQDVRNSRSLKENWEKRAKIWLGIAKDAVVLILTFVLTFSLLIAMFTGVEVPWYIEFSFLFFLIVYFGRGRGQELIQGLKQVLKSQSDLKDLIPWGKLLSSKLSMLVLLNIVTIMAF